jgi:hypothetical protein
VGWQNFQNCAVNKRELSRLCADWLNAPNLFRNVPQCRTWVRVGKMTQMTQTAQSIKESYRAYVRVGKNTQTTQSIKKS